MTIPDISVSVRLNNIPHRYRYHDHNCVLPRFGGHSHPGRIHVPHSSHHPARWGRCQARTVRPLSPTPRRNPSSCRRHLRPLCQNPLHRRCPIAHRDKFQLARCSHSCRLQDGLEEIKRVLNGLIRNITVYITKNESLNKIDQKYLRCSFRLSLRIPWEQVLTTPRKEPFLHMTFLKALSWMNSLNFTLIARFMGAPGGRHVGPTNFAVWVYVSPKFVPED